MQDYNYIEASCYELTVENSCCKYPPANRLPTFWEADRKPLLDLLQKVHMGKRVCEMQAGKVTARENRSNENHINHTTKQ